MRLVFFILLLANGVVLLLLQSARTPGIEPERIAAQLHPERLTVLEETPPRAVAAAPAPEQAPEPAPEPAPEADPPPPEQAPEPAPEADPPPATPSACVDIGDFTTLGAAEFEAEFARLSHGTLPSKRLVKPPQQHIVYLPPQASEAAARRRLAQLRDMGFADSAIIRDEPTRRWGISLGLFSRVELAETQQQKLREAGVTDARVAEYPVNSARYAYRITGLDAATSERLGTLASGLRGGADVVLRSCQ